MQIKNKISLARKTLYGIMLLGLFFSAFGAGSLTSVRAQDGVASTPTPEETATSIPTVESVILTPKDISENPMATELSLESFDFGNLPTEAYNAMIEAIQVRSSGLWDDGTYFVVGTYEEEGVWGIGHVTAAAQSEPPDWERSIWFISHNSDIWQIALQESPQFEALMANLPASLNDQLAKENNTELGALAESFLFPWDKSQVWRYTQGWHGTGSLSLDFAPSNVAVSNMWILASATGPVTQQCGDNYQAFVKLSASSGVTTYGHIDYNSFISQGVKNTTVSQGKKLGILYNGTQGAGYYKTTSAWPWPSCTAGTSGCSYMRYKTNCGAGTGAHTHWSLPSKPFTVDGWQVNTNNQWTKSGQTTKNVGASFNSTNPPLGFAAQFISQSVSTTMAAGNTYPVSVTFKNTGTTAWTESSKFRLGSQNPADNNTWDVGRVYLAAGETIAPGQSKTFTFNIIAPATPGTYNFQWKMLQEAITWFGDLSTNIAITVSQAPSAPSLSAPSSGQYFNEGDAINLSWSSTGSEYYGEIWGGPSGTLTFSWQTGTSKNIGSQWSGYTYSWKTKAKNSLGESAWSETRTFTVRPSTPTSLSATPASCNQINLNWTDNSGNEEGYKVYRNSSQIATLGSGVTSYQSTGLVGSTNYSYTIKAYRGSIESNLSNTASATTSACASSTPTLNSPVNNITVGRYDPVTLSWNSASGAVQYYAEFWGDSGLSVNSGWTSNLSYAVGSTFWGGTYQWHVKSRNSSNVESGWSETRTLIRTYGAPSGLTTSGGSQGQINLSWSASADAPDNIQGYRIYQNGIEVATVGSSTNTYQDNGLLCNTTYSYTVKAFKGSLESNASNSASVSIVNCSPAMPGNLTIGSTTESSLTLNWQDNANNETGFKIYRWGYDESLADWGFIYLTSVGANMTSYTQTGLDCGSDFNYYEVSAYNANGESAHAGWIQGVTAACLQSELSITDITIYSASSYTNEDIYVYVDVSNLSSNDASGHWVDFYIDDAPIGCSDWGDYYVWSDGLLANDTQTWEIRIPANSLTAGVHQFRAYIDSGCDVTENNESNNISDATSFTLTVSPVSPPLNDDFDAALTVSPIPYDDIVDVSGATTALDDPYVPDCGDYGLNPGMKSVWYKYTPSTDSNLYLDTLGSSYDTYIAVWSGSRSELSQVGCNDDYDGAGGNYQSALTVNLTAGTTYYFQVAQFSGTTYLSAASAASLKPIVVLPPGASFKENTATRQHTTEILSMAKSEKPLKEYSDMEAQAGETLQFHVFSTAATLTSPIGSININYNPVYQWSRANPATYYRLYVSGPSGVVLDQWFEASSICDATTCSVTTSPSSTLTGGNYSWFVQTYGPAGYGPWSNNAQPTNFSTTIPTVPTAAVLTAPKNAIGTDYNPNYTWGKVATATYYHLYVAGPSGVVLDQWYPAASICPAATCFVPSPVLAGGNYAWYVQTYNPVGYGPWSNNAQPTTFSTTMPSVPAAAVLTAPKNDIVANYNPTYTWGRVATATYYHLYVSGPVGVVLDQWYQASNICNTITCSVASPTLGGGTYAWYVQTYNLAGYGLWSNNAQPTNFNTSTALPAAAVLTAPKNNIGTDYNPTYTWGKVAAATYYRLYVSGPSGVVLDQSYPASICDATTCTVASPILGGGMHAWYVQTYNPAGYGLWSNNAQPTTFSTTMPSAPAAAVLTAPKNAIGTDYNPTYTWGKVVSASYYHLYVAGPSGVVLDQWYPASGICNTTTCSVISPILGGGAHVWYVQTYNAAGYGPWSNNAQPTNFSTTTPSAPVGAVLTAPSGTTSLHTPTYTWDRVSMATWYHLYIKGPSGVVKDQWYQASSICNATTCSIASPTLESGYYTWWVQTYNSAGYGPWKNATFTVSP